MLNRIFTMVAMIRVRDTLAQNGSSSMSACVSAAEVGL